MGGLSSGGQVLVDRMVMGAGGSASAGLALETRKQYPLGGPPCRWVGRALSVLERLWGQTWAEES